MSATSESFEIRTATEQDTEGVLQHLRQHFYGDEPLNRFLYQESNEPMNAADRGLTNADCIKYGLCLVAVTPSNQVIGLAINKDIKLDTEGENHPNFIKISKMLHLLEDQTNELAKLKTENEKEMTVRIVSVDPKWRNKGIGVALLKHSCDAAKQNGFTQIRSYCTSAYSAKIFEKLGFQCVHAIKYEDYKEDGKVAFKPDPPHTHVRAMVLRF